MITDASPLGRMFETLAAHTELEPDDRAAVLALPHSIRWLNPATYILREGERSSHCSVLLQGFAYRHKIVAEGARQIVGICLPGELLDLHAALLDRSDENIQSLSGVRVASIPVDALHRLMDSHRRVSRAIMARAMVEAAVYREWMANIGRRDARARMAHFLCELAVRQQAVGIAQAKAYELPMTQEQLADLLGLTSVHVNRTLQVLEADGLIERQRRRVAIVDWNALAGVGDFRPHYLHLGTPVEVEPLRYYA
jgi:CRP-like cAMP-binding protein